MKQLFTLLLLSGLFSSGLKAQLVLTQAGFEPAPGDVQIILQQDSINVLSRAQGQNLVWDFSAMVPKSNSVYSYTRTFMSLTLAPPAASVFPHATIMANIAPGQYEFYKSVTSPTPQLEFIGAVYSTRVDSFPDTRIDQQWPIAYGTTSSDTFSETIYVTGTNSTIPITGTVNMAATGTGTLLLPGGYRLDNVLQVVKTTYSIATDASSNPPVSSFSVTTWSYYHAISKFPVVTVTDYKTNMTAVVPDYSTVEYNRPLALGILESRSEFAFAMYPNPAVNNFNISLSNTKNEKCTVQVYDVAGKLVSGKNLGDGSDIKETIPLPGLPAGVYVVKIQLGSKTAFKRLVVE